MPEDAHTKLHIYEGDSALVIRENGNKSLYGVQLPELLALFNDVPETSDELKPVAYSFELAGLRTVDGDYTCFGKPKLSFEYPVVPDGAVRNLTPLYAHRIPTAADTGLVERLTARVAELERDRDEELEKARGDARFNARRYVDTFSDLKTAMQQRDKHLRRAEAAEQKLITAQERIAQLEVSLAFADEQTKKLEALLEPHIKWDTPKVTDGQ